jgi:hypothetical protein
VVGGGCRCVGWPSLLGRFVECQEIDHEFHRHAPQQPAVGGTLNCYMLDMAAHGACHAHLVVRASDMLQDSEGKVAAMRGRGAGLDLTSLWQAVGNVAGAGREGADALAGDAEGVGSNKEQTSVEESGVTDH